MKFKLFGKEQVIWQLWIFQESNAKAKSTFTFFFFLFESMPPHRLFPIVRYLGLGNVLKITQNKDKIQIDWLIKKCDFIKENFGVKWRALVLKLGQVDWQSNKDVRWLLTRRWERIRTKRYPWWYFFLLELHSSDCPNLDITGSDTTFAWSLRGWYHK